MGWFSGSAAVPVTGVGVTIVPVAGVRGAAVLVAGVRVVAVAVILLSDPETFTSP